MAKDRLNYRASRKHAAGSLAVEKSIGITKLLSSSFAATAHETDDDRLLDRPTGLMKWSFDDVVIEEVLPPELLAGTTATHSRTEQRGQVDAAGGDHTEATAPASGETLLLRVTSEGVPDSVIERLLRSRLPRNVPFHFLTPVDFLSSTVRHVWVRGNDHELAQLFTPPGRVGAHSPLTTAAASDGNPPTADSVELVRTPSGEVWLGPCFSVPVSADAPHFPLSLLPHLRYTVVMRNVPGSLNAMLPQLQSLQLNGFVNYGHAARHGLGALRSYEDGKALMERDYCRFLQSYARSLTEGTPFLSREMPSLLEALASPRATAKEWRSVAHGVEMGMRQDLEALPQWQQTGLFHPHHDMLHELVTRAADIAPRHHDLAQVIREAVPRRILLEKLRVVSEVHFNALGSIRLGAGGRGGAGVRPGDLVLLDNAAAATGTFNPYRDVYEGFADHVEANMVSEAHQDWVYLAQDALVTAQKELAALGQLRVVQTAAEAATYRLDQVVLPLYGRGISELPLLSSGGTDAAAAAASATGVACADHFHALARELHVEGLSAMRTAPLASFRHLVCRPKNFGAYLFDEQRGWDWVVDEHHSTAGVGTQLKRDVYRDQEGIFRVRSPLMALNGKNMIARRGIRDVAAVGRRGGRGGGEASARHHFLKPARKPGITCVMRMDLPRGSPVTSALREVFQFTTLSPTAIFHLLANKRR